jgi:TolA-binding protein
MFSILLLLAAAPVLDAGVKVKKPALDAGVTVIEPARPLEPTAAAPVPKGPTTAEVEQLRRDVVDLKSRTVQLERQSAQAEVMSQQLSKLSKQISELQGQLSETENRRAESERRAIEKRERSEAAIASLGGALQQLANGNGNVGPAIGYAESTFTGTALSNVQAAKAALANNDLGSARVWLNLAIAEAQANR